MYVCMYQSSILTLIRAPHCSFFVLFFVTYTMLSSFYGLFMVHSLPLSLPLFLPHSLPLSSFAPFFALSLSHSLTLSLTLSFDPFRHEPFPLLPRLKSVGSCQFPPCHNLADAPSLRALTVDTTGRHYSGCSSMRPSTKGVAEKRRRVPWWAGSLCIVPSEHGSLQRRPSSPTDHPPRKTKRGRRGGARGERSLEGAARIRAKKE